MRAHRPHRWQKRASRALDAHRAHFAISTHIAMRVLKHWPMPSTRLWRRASTHSMHAAASSMEFDDRQRASTQ
jgi:hypothetical protein